MSDIAVVGLSFQIPGADSSEAFWDLMMSGKNVARQFPADRVSNSKYDATNENLKGTISPHNACFLQRDVTAFDAEFFGMSSDEALGADPQQRILLEVTYRALENAGITLNDIDGSDTSVFTGCFSADYMLCCGKDPQSQPKYAATGVAASMLSNRISTFFNLTGPSATVDTACSSSLVALDMACESVKRGESSMAIVAGCNILLSPDYFIGLSALGFLSPDGVCQSFDSRANGYGRGEGFGVLIIKSVDDAIRDGDTIRAVIRATGTNQNGRTTLAHPSKEMQAQLIQSVYDKAQLNPLDTQFFEAHGTGTAIGDPLEAMAIGKVFGRGRNIDQPLIIGALKANIGHLEGCAGIAGVIKTILVLEHGTIPPIARLQKLNNAIDSDFLKLQFPKEPVPWPTTGLRRASVNSFGFGGTNAHAVLDDAHHYLEMRGLVANHRTIARCPSSSADGDSRAIGSEISVCMPEAKPSLFVWSAYDEHAVTSMVDLHGQCLKAPSDTEMSLDDLAYTLSQKRTIHDWRAFVVAESKSDIAAQLKLPMTPTHRRSKVNLAFVFTGQGAQWTCMGKQLLAYPVFRDTLSDADTYLQSLGCEWRIIDVLVGNVAEPAVINEPCYAQPLCTVIQIALVELLRSFQIVPTTVVGHSSGEIAAAFAMGAIDKTSAWKIAYFRGLVSGELADRSSSTEESSGAMMAVGLPESAVRPLIDEILHVSGEGVLSVACINSPNNCTVAGDKPLVLAAQTALEKDGIFARILKVPVAYHSSHMLQVAPRYQELIGDIHSGDTKVQHVNMISSVTGKSVTMGELQNPQYWVRNLTSPVRFADALSLICHQPQVVRKKLDLSHRAALSVTDFVEIGPHSTLRGPIREVVDAASSTSLSSPPALAEVPKFRYAPTLVRGQDAIRTVLDMVGNLYCLGSPIDMMSVNRLNERVNKTLEALPEYPFNHSKSYWDEPRISRNTRLELYPYNRYIGSPVPDWNPLFPRWRNTITTSSVPWTEEHKINGEILYPAAGMCVMAMEAIRQITTLQEISGFEIRDFHIRSALRIPPDDVGVEVELCLGLSSDASDKTDSWANFSLMTRRNESFTEICTGSVRAVRTSAIQSQPDYHGDHPFGYFKDQIERLVSADTPELQAETLYRQLEAWGYDYGPLFQGIELARRNSRGEVVGYVSTNRPWMGLTSKDSAPIHPATLDSMWQLMIQAFLLADIGQWKTWIPTHISKMWISAAGLGASDNTKRTTVFASTVRKGTRLCESVIHAADEERGIVLMQIEGVESMAVITEDTKTDDDSQSKQLRRLCYSVDRKPDLSMLDNDQVLQYISEGPMVDDPTNFRNLLNLYITSSLLRIVSTVTQADVPLKPRHLRQQYDWIVAQVETAKNRTPPEYPANWQELAGDVQFNELTQCLERTGRLGEIYTRFNAHSVDIIRGSKDALHILAEDDTLRDYYDEFNKQAKFFNPLARYLDGLAHKNPGMKVMEVGAGTGSTTKYILDALSVQAPMGLSSRFSQYDFTDISPAFLEKARLDFGKTPKLNFCLFDVECDPTTQNVERHSYDLIIAVNVLHATKSLGRSLSNIRQLLKSSGKLIIIEITKATSTLAPFIFGYLPGWWQSEEPWRQNGPCATTDQWDQELRLNGFSGTDLVLEDSSLETNRFQSLMVSSAIEPHAQEPMMVGLKRAVVISGWDESPESFLTRSIVSELSHLTGLHVRMGNFCESSLGNLSDELVIIVQDDQTIPLADLSTTQYNMLRTVMKNAVNILWFSVKTRLDATSPSGMIEGLARVLRAETYGRVFSLVSLDASTDNLMPGVIQKSLANFLDGIDNGDYEPEIIQIGDTLQIPRVYESLEHDQRIQNLTSQLVEREVPFGERNLELQLRQPGLLDTLQFTEIPTSVVPLSSKEVSVRVEAIGINFRDCLIALGRADQDILGSECSGTVIDKGPDCQLSVGDRVIVSTLGTFRSHVRCQESLAIKIPDGINLTHAAGLATIFITAHHSLIKLARLSRTDSVLIHSGAGGTGQAAIQIAKLCGARIFTTVGSTNKAELLSRIYDIPPNHILNSRDLSFATEIKRLTDGKGVDVVLNSLAGDALLASWECVAPYGRFIEIGKKDITAHSKLPMSQFARNVSFSAVDVGAMTYERPDMIQEAMSSVVDLLVRGQISLPEPIKVFPVSQVEQAFRYLQGGTHSGKVVIEVQQHETLQAAVRPHLDWQLCPDETFVIAGGFGAQGKKIARWLTSKGARHLVLLSRTGELKDENRAFLEDLRATGVNLYCPQCDIADEQSLSAALKHCETTMPPIKGCVHTAMQLEDSIFENMTHEMWQACIRPKVQGSWNLHNLLPDDLDFFVLFSSIAGVIGSQGQANYAAGNTFQDALAEYRVKRGEKAISINFGLLEDGWATEHRDAMLQFMNTKHIMPISETEVLAVLDHYCNKDNPSSPSHWQLALGLELQADVIKRGLEPAVWMRERMFGNLAQISSFDADQDDGRKGSGENDEELTSQVAAAESFTQAANVVAARLASKLAKILSLKEGSFDLGRPIHVYGVDSLVAVELRNWLRKAAKIDVAIFEILGSGTAFSLGQVIAEKILAR